MADKNINSSSKKKSPAHAAAKKMKKKSVLSDKKYIAILGISLTILLCTFFVAMGFGFSSYGGHNMEVLPSEEPEITSDSLVPVDKATGKINILLLGVDVEGLRTDTMIVLSYDLDDNKVKMLSIPRDTRMYIGKKYQKINAAHAITQSGNIKGPQGAIEAVTRLTGIPINYYVEFSFATFRNTIDSLGGVYFDVPRNMDYEDPVQDLYIHLKQGYQLLDGDKSEQLVRFRRYAMGDLERVEMQQKFISALLEQKLNADTFKNLPALFEQWKNDINTNLSLTDMLKLIPNMKELSTENITMLSVPGHYNDTDYGASYWIAHMNELAEIIRTEFEYDASKITIHSADGSSKSKDLKTTSLASKSGSSGSSKNTPEPAADEQQPADQEEPNGEAIVFDQTPRPVRTLPPDNMPEITPNIKRPDVSPKTAAPSAGTINEVQPTAALKPADEPDPNSGVISSPKQNKPYNPDISNRPNNTAASEINEKTVTTPVENPVKTPASHENSVKIPIGDENSGRTPVQNENKIENKIENKTENKIENKVENKSEQPSDGGSASAPEQADTAAIKIS